MFLFLIYNLIIVLAIIYKPNIGLLNGNYSEIINNLKMIFLVFLLYLILNTLIKIDLDYLKIDLIRFIKIIGLNLLLYSSICYLYLSYNYNIYKKILVKKLKIDIKAVIIAPIVEEFLFRFFIHQYFSYYSFNLTQIYLLSSFSFLFQHIPLRFNMIKKNYKPFIFSFIIYLIFGFIFFRFYIKFKTIISSIISHSIANFISMPDFSKYNKLNSNQKIIYKFIWISSLIAFFIII